MPTTYQNLALNGWSEPQKYAHFLQIFQNKEKLIHFWLFSNSLNKATPTKNKLLYKRNLQQVQTLLTEKPHQVF